MRILKMDVKLIEKEFTAKNLYPPSWDDDVFKEQPAMPRKMEDPVTLQLDEAAQPKKRGRPRKNPSKPPLDFAKVETSTPTKRGRPKKNLETMELPKQETSPIKPPKKYRRVVEQLSSSSEGEASRNEEEFLPKRRGHLNKNNPPIQLVQAILKPEIKPPNKEDEILPTNSFRKVYFCPKEECGFWALGVDDFHDHIVAIHGPGEQTNTKCSCCLSCAQQWSFVNHYLKSCGIESLNPVQSNFHFMSTTSVLELLYTGTTQLVMVQDALNQGPLIQNGDSLQVLPQEPFYGESSCVSRTDPEIDLSQISIEDFQKVEACCAAQIPRRELEIPEDLRFAEVNQSDPLLTKLMDEQAPEMKFEQNWGSPGEYAHNHLSLQEEGVTGGVRENPAASNCFQFNDLNVDPLAQFSTLATPMPVVEAQPRKRGRPKNPLTTKNPSLPQTKVAVQTLNKRGRPPSKHMMEDKENVGTQQKSNPTNQVFSTVDLRDLLKPVENPQTDELFKCSKCNSSFRHKHALTRHFKTRHLDVEVDYEYKCYFCGSKEIRSDKMRDHFKTNHPNEAYDRKKAKRNIKS